MQEKIENTLKQDLKPEFLEVINESHKHIVPKGAESHFKITVVSESFAGLAKIKRHKVIYQTLEKIINEIHALSMGLYTPDEWQTKAHTPHRTPPCAGQRKTT